MIISRNMNIEQLRDLMGGSYTEADAKRFRDLLIEHGFSGVDTSYVERGETWHDILDVVDSEASE